MSKHKLFLIFMALSLAAMSFANLVVPDQKVLADDGATVNVNGLNYYKNQRVTQAEREAAAERFKAARAAKPAVQPGVVPSAVAPSQLDPGGTPHYFGPYANWAYSPLPKGAVTAVTVDAGGSEYSATPTVDITDVYGTGAGATATATVVGGIITDIAVTNGGNNYTAPIVTITDTTGVDAAASATIGGTLTGGIRKFINSLPGVGPGGINDLGQYIPIAVSDTSTYTGDDYYEIALVEYEEQLHTDLPPTRLRGYVQLETPIVTGNHIALTYPNGTPILGPDCAQVYAVDNPHYLGPLIIAGRDVPVRIKFTNYLPKGAGGDLFLPVDTTTPGAGPGPVMGESFTQNRAAVHLHGNNSPWISDGTPHQWITPADEDTPYPQGVAVYNVPDMPDPGDGSMTFFYTNAHSARLMFYHDHAYGITRLNVYAGEAAGYLVTDQVEKDMIEGTNVSGVNPTNANVLPDIGIPLVIQDKTFVDPTTIAHQDPTWNNGTTPPLPHAGDLWYPHVYMPNQNPWDIGGMNAFGRWHYGPWFFPPTTDITYPPVVNPYYGPASPWEPPLMPATPNPSSAGEAFMDTPIVNGTAYPYLNVEPRTYRFRILSAADDRFLNLQFYQAYDPVTQTVGTGKEVKMVPAAITAGFPAYWPTDGREGGVPDPATRGPSFIQVGTEGGFLPAPVVLPTKPVNWNYDQTNFDFGNVNQGTLILGTAERADVLVDFRDFAGKTLILYNDSPAPFPAIDARYDYYTGKPDLTDTGGSPTTLPGYGPNTRTIMQIRVAASPIAPAYNVATLNSVFAKTGAKNGVFDVSQDQVIVPNSNYNSAYNASFPAPITTFTKIFETSKTFQTVPGDTVTLGMQPKAIHDEMGGVFDIDYGRQSAMLGLEVPITSAANQNFVVFPYAGPPVELIKGSVYGTPIGSLGDGTQIWKITHNGVDTHTVHFHLYNVQLINRVAWDGAFRAPDPNELGWKETLRVNPLQDTIVALRPFIPTSVPFPVPNSVHLMDETTGAGDALRPPPPIKEWADPTGEPIETGILNHTINFGWEYVYHCHLLAHEEMDMMHSQVFAVPPEAPSNVGVAVSGPQATVTWNDNSLGETGFTIQRAKDSSFTDNLTTFTVGPNVTSYLDTTIEGGTYYYFRVMANNMVGDTDVYPAPSVGFEHFSFDSALSNIATDNTSPPMPPVLSLPADTAIVGSLTPTLEWNASTGADSYGVQVSTRDDFVTTILSQTGITDLFLNIPVSTLDWNTTYYWRVNATNGIGTSAWSTVWSFTPAQVTPVAPVLASPANGSTVYSLTPWLHWNEATGAASYGIQVSTDPGFGTTVINQSGIERLCFNIPLGALAYDTTYHWRVNATNPNGTSGWSGVWSFQTAPPPPAIPVLASPADLSVVNTLTPTLAWNSSLNADSYGVQVSIDPGFGTTVVNQTGITDLFFNVPAATLSWNSTYYWRVNASNVNGTSDWSTVWSFQTVPSLQNLVGTDTTSTGIVGANYINMSRFIATGTGTVTQIRVFGAAAGNVKVAIYNDNTGEPGALLSANNGNNAVIAGQWNNITIPDASITSGNAYWLGAIMDTNSAVTKVVSPNPYRYRAQTYAGFSWPGSVTGLSAADSIYLCIAGWGIAGTTPLGIVTTSLADGMVGTAYSQTLQASGGTGIYSWSIIVGTLPPGLGLTPSTGAIAGTPTVGGTSNFTVQVNDGSTTATKPLSITIVQTLVGTNTSSTGAVGTDYINLSRFTASATGTVNQIRVFGTAAGNVKVAIYNDIAGEPGSLLNANNSNNPVIGGQWNSISITDTGVIAGNAYWLGAITDTTNAVTKVVSPNPYRYKAQMYAGFSWTGALTGLSAADSIYICIAGASTGPAPLAIVTASLPDGNISTPYSQTLQASGGTGSYTWSIPVGTLPDGLSLTPATGLISGTPTTLGTSNFTVRVNDGSTTVDKPLSITINPASVAQNLVGTNTTNTGIVGANYINLSRFIATGTGTVSQIRVYGAAAGNVKVAIYADAGGEPGALLVANNSNNPVLASQWNNITIANTPVTSGNAYWLGAIMDTNSAVTKVVSPNPYRYMPMTYAGFSWPGSLAGLSTSDTIYLCIAGWSQ